MDFYAFIATFVGGAIARVRRASAPASGAFGTTPTIPQAREQAIMTLKMPSAKGWAPGETPDAAKGLAVNAFAAGLDHPRWIEVLPNGDVLVAEASQIDSAADSFFKKAQQAIT